MSQNGWSDRSGESGSSGDVVICDERFHTPRAQASTGRSTCGGGNNNGHYGTPRSTREDFSTARTHSSSEGEWATPRSSASAAAVVHPRWPAKPQIRETGGYVDGYDFNGAQSHLPGRRGVPFPEHVVDGARSSAEERAVGTDVVEETFSLARHGRAEDVEKRLSEGFPVNARDENGNTLLGVSCQNGHKRVAKSCLRHGADVDARNHRGNTALHFCFKYGFGNTLGAYLISKGADANIPNLAGKTCLEEGRC